MDEKKPWLHKSQSQMTPEEHLRALQAVGVKINRTPKTGSIASKPFRTEKENTR